MVEFGGMTLAEPVGGMLPGMVLRSFMLETLYMYRERIQRARSRRMALC